MNLNHTKNALTIIILLIAPAITFAQNQNTVDSLKSIINNKKAEDTITIHAYLDLAYEYKNINLDSVLSYADLALNKSLKINYKKGIADANRRKGVTMTRLNKYKLADSLLNIAISTYLEINQQTGVVECYVDLAASAYYKGENRLFLEYSQKALKIVEDKNFVKFKSTILINIGVAYKEMGDYEKAIEYALNALKTFEELGNKKMIAICYINLGNFFIEINEFDKSIDYMNKSLEIFIELKDMKRQSICFANIGDVYLLQEKYNEALQCYNKALELDKKNLYATSTNYGNIGSVYFEQGKYDTANEYFNKSLKIKDQIGDKSGLAICYLNISQVETKLKNYELAEEYCLISIELFKQNNELDNLRKSLYEISSIYNIIGKHQKAYNMHIEATNLKDSLFSMEKVKKITQLEERYLNEKLEKQNLKLKSKVDLQQTEIFQQKKLRNIYLIAFVIAILIVIIFRKNFNINKFLFKKNIDLSGKYGELKEITTQLSVSILNNSSKTSISVNEKEKILRKMDKLFNDDKIFTKFDLTIDKLAKRLSTNRYYLYRIINDEFGKKYSDFINEYRVNEAMILLSDSLKCKQFSIEALAKEAGFKTISNFNSSFKKFTGTTPSEFKQSTNPQQVESLIYTD